MKRSIPGAGALAAAALFLLPLGCSESEAGSESQVDSGTARAEEPESKSPALQDAPLAEWQAELVDVAFEASTAFPIDPHIKNRSRAQEAVVRACLELEQLERALDYIPRIGNWRRGLCYAELAFHCAERGETDVRPWLEQALEISADAEEWRRDSIRVRVASTYVLIGNEDEARRLETNLVSSEQGKVDAVRVQNVDPGDFDARLESLDAIVSAADFDLARNAFAVCAGLFDRFFEDEERRSRVRDTIAASLGKMPPQIQVEVLAELCEVALGHGNQAVALELVDEAREALDGAEWLPQDYVPQAAMLAGQRYLAGDEEAARAAADAARELFEEKREVIVDIWRAKALRPLAEAYQTMGDTETALRVYKRAVEEGFENPNSRPRAMDLSATCCSMALAEVEPDAYLWSRLREIFNALGDPW